MYHTRTSHGKMSVKEPVTRNPRQSFRMIKELSVLTLLYLIEPLQIWPDPPNLPWRSLLDRL